MGSRPSTRIQTPPLKQQQWLYIPAQQTYPEYGLYRPMQHRTTGERIDEYDMTWLDEQSYEQYLRSVNFRHNNSYVVNIRHLSLKTEQQFCGQTYRGKVYIQHITHRLSEITDIPYPDNLYLLMEALEGYARIYKHSKYFRIEEGQVCVDVQGNIKVWVNTDLSINYPNSDSESAERHCGEEDMVERLVFLVGDNTDRESEPETSFMYVWGQVGSTSSREREGGGSGSKRPKQWCWTMPGKCRNRFRMYDAVIPDRFQAVFKEEEGSEGEGEDRFVTASTRREDDTVFYHQQPTVVVPPPVQPVSQHYHYQHPQQYQQGGQPVYHIPHYQRVEYPVHPSHQNHQNHQSYQNHQNYHNYQSYQPQQYGQQIEFTIPAQRQHPQHPHQPYPYSNTHYNNQQSNTSHSHTYQESRQPQTQTQINHHLDSEPFHQRQVTTSNNNNNNNISNISNSNNNNSNNSYQYQHERHNSHPTVILESKQEYQASDLQNSRRSNPHIDLSPTTPEAQSPGDLRITFNKAAEKENIVKGRPSAQMEACFEPQNSQEQREKGTGRYRSSGINQFSNNTVSECDDMVAKSVPIKGGNSYASAQNSQQLSNFGQNIYSHINQKQREEGQQLQQSLGKDHRMIQSKKTDSNCMPSIPSMRTDSYRERVKVDPSKTKYYYSLEKELEIDPDIAADMARYLR